MLIQMPLKGTWVTETAPELTKAHCDVVTFTCSFTTQGDASDCLCITCRASWHSLNCKCGPKSAPCFRASKLASPLHHRLELQPSTAQLKAVFCCCFCPPRTGFVWTYPCAHWNQRLLALYLFYRKFDHM